MKQNNKIISLELPYPPSVNKYWLPNIIKGRFKGMRISEAGKNYKTEVYYKFLSKYKNKHPPFECDLSVSIRMYPPDKGPRDIDNILKSLLDSLEYAKVYENDSQIVDLHIKKLGIVKGGKIEVDIIELIEKL